MLTELAAASGRSLFGLCPMCQHLQIVKAQNRKSYACRLLGEPLQTEEVSQICARFLPKAG
jgi:hypothetical protein